MMLRIVIQHTVQLRHKVTGKCHCISRHFKNIFLNSDNVIVSPRCISSNANSMSGVTCISTLSTMVALHISFGNTFLLFLHQIRTSRYFVLISTLRTRRSSVTDVSYSFNYDKRSSKISFSKSQCCMPPLMGCAWLMRRLKA